MINCNLGGSPRILSSFWIVVCLYYRFTAPIGLCIEVVDSYWDFCEIYLLYEVLIRHGPQIALEDDGRYLRVTGNDQTCNPDGSVKTLSLLFLRAKGQKQLDNTGHEGRPDFLVYQLKVCMRLIYCFPTLTSIIRRHVAMSEVYIHRKAIAVCSECSPIVGLQLMPLWRSGNVRPLGVVNYSLPTNPMQASHLY